jgi:Flavodoxins
LKTAILYYSRTGNTESLVKLLVDALSKQGVTVDVFKVKPLKEYSPPLHLNPRLVFDTLVRKGTSVILEPVDFNPLNYSVIVVASPIWIGNLSPPIQQVLREYAGKLKNYIILTTSGLKTKCESLSRKTESVIKEKPVSCLNITVPEIRNEALLTNIIQNLANRILSHLMAKH